MKKYEQAELNLKKARAVEERVNRAGELLTVTAPKLAQLEFLRANPAKADEYRHQDRTGEFNHMTRVLPYLAPAQQIEFLDKKATGFNEAMSQALLYRERADSRRLSTEWLVNDKGANFRTLTRREQELRLATNPAARQRLDQLQQLRAEMAGIATARYKLAEAEAANRQLAALATQEDRLNRELTDLVGLKPKDTWVRLADLQARLKADDVLVEFVRVAKHTLQPVEAKDLPEVYAAWVVTAADVQVVELGSAATIDGHLKDVRKHLADARAVTRINPHGDRETHTTTKGFVPDTATTINWRNTAVGEKRHREIYESYKARHLLVPEQHDLGHLGASEWGLDPEGVNRGQVTSATPIDGVKRPNYTSQPSTSNRYVGWKTQESGVSAASPRAKVRVKVTSVSLETRGDFRELHRTMHATQTVNGKTETLSRPNLLHLGTNDHVEKQRRAAKAAKGKVQSLTAARAERKAKTKKKTR